MKPNLSPVVVVLCAFAILPACGKLESSKESIGYKVSSSATTSIAGLNGSCTAGGTSGSALSGDGGSTGQVYTNDQGTQYCVVINPISLPGSISTPPAGRQTADASFIGPSMISTSGNCNGIDVDLNGGGTGINFTNTNPVNLQGAGPLTFYVHAGATCSGQPVMTETTCYSASGTREVCPTSLFSGN